MQELKQVVLNSVNKSNVLMILDCCYSGIPLKAQKARNPYLISKSLLILILEI